MIDVLSETVSIDEQLRTSIERAAAAALAFEKRNGDLTILIDRRPQTSFGDHSDGGGGAQGARHSRRAQRERSDRFIFRLNKD